MEVPDVLVSVKLVKWVLEYFNSGVPSPSFFQRQGYIETKQFYAKNKGSLAKKTTLMTLTTCAYCAAQPTSNFKLELFRCRYTLITSCNARPHWQRHTHPKWITANANEWLRKACTCQKQNISGTCSNATACSKLHCKAIAAAGFENFVSAPTRPPAERRQ